MPSRRARVCLRAGLDGVLEVSCEGHGSAFLLSLFLVLPVRLGLGDVALLAFLGSADQQQDKALAILAKIHPVAGAKVDTPLRDAFTDGLHVSETARRSVRPSQLKRMRFLAAS